MIWASASNIHSTCGDYRKKAASETLGKDFTSAGRTQVTMTLTGALYYVRQSASIGTA